MNKQQTFGDTRIIFWALAMVMFAAVYRVVSGLYLTSLPNFAPAMAMAFCCGLALPGVLSVAAPLGLLFVSDLILNSQFGQPLVGPGMLAAYACYLVAIGFGRALRGRGLLPILGATVANSIFFYVVTNALSWWQNPNYPQSFAGLIQSLTVGQPGLPPTWMFFRNSFLSDIIFTGVFLVLLYAAGRRRVADGLPSRPGAY